MNSIKVILIEDEHFAAAALTEALAGVVPAVEILATLDSVASATAWLRKYPLPDLIFSDIQLGDGLSFAIFEQLNLRVPIVFVTAFDEYAIRAFQMNSLHYLLKPVEEDALQMAVTKFTQTQMATPVLPVQWQQINSDMAQRQRYRTRFLVQSGDTIAAVPVDEIAYFEGDDRYVMLVHKTGKRFIVDYLLRDLEAVLDPTRFFRLNRSFIAQIDAIEQINVLSKSKLKARLRPDAKRDVIVSAATATQLKQWLDEQTH